MFPDQEHGGRGNPPEEPPATLIWRTTPKIDQFLGWFFRGSSSFFLFLQFWKPLNKENPPGGGGSFNQSAGLGLVQKNVRILWNPVYKAFHRIRLCGNERSGLIVNQTWSWWGKPAAIARAPVPPLSLIHTWLVPLPVCNHSQGVYFPPNTEGKV